MEQLLDVCLEVALAASFFEEAYVFDDDAFGHRFAHVVKGQGSDAGSGQGLHFNAGFGVGDHFGSNDHARVV